MRALILIALCGCLFACQAKPPTTREQADICDIFDDRKEWYRSAAEARRKHHTPIHVSIAIMKAESSFDDDARPARKRHFFGLIPGSRPSSAYGYAQAVDGTWNQYKRDTGNNGAERDDFDDAIDFIAWYVDRTHRQAGVSRSNAKAQYLAYHEGVGGYQRGSWRGKSWLVRKADSVAADANRYRRQLDGCERKLKRNWIPFF